MRPLRPRDFIECQGVLAAVTSVLHPEGPVVTPRYERRAGALHKLGAAEGVALVADRHADWLVSSPLLGADVVLVPLERIERVYRPEDRVAELASSTDPAGVAERAGRAVADMVASGVPRNRLGLTGSLLVGAATPDSDIDMVAYGRGAFLAARRALADLVARGRWRALAEGDWHGAWERRGRPITFESYRRHEERKGTKALVDGTRVDLSLLQDPGEGSEERPPYRKLGRFELDALVTDDAAAFDYPSRYAVAHEEVHEVVSYTATYAGQARSGERLRARGWREVDGAGVPRLLVGTSREAAGEWLLVAGDAA